MRMRTTCFLAVSILAGLAGPAGAQDRLCDPANEDCRAILIQLIRNEPVAIDVAFWFMEDARYTAELIRKHQSGVQVRVLIDPRANASYPLNAQRLEELRAAGIPMRRRLTSYILHWKTMLFHGQNVVEFSGANYSADAWGPRAPEPYVHYVDEAIYFTSDTPIVDSFRTKFDDQWIDVVNWADYANVSRPLARQYVISPKHPSLNFPPDENFRTRSVNLYRTETQRIDAIMYRITDRQHTDNILAAVARGVAVRLITEPEQYRDRTRLWHAWNVDRLYMGGVQVRHRAHAGLNHQKSVILYGHQTTIFGSSNWTSPSAAGQLEHNLFTTKPYVLSWFVSQFERKWNNATGVPETMPFVPLPPDAPAAPTPADRQTVLSSTVTLRWYGGPWAHTYDVYLGTSPDPPRIAADLTLGPSASATQTQSYTVTLAPGRTYYWRVVGKTMAAQQAASPVWSFTTGGSSAPVLIWRQQRTGDVSAWLMEGTTVMEGEVFRQGVPLEWQIAAVRDLDGDGTADLVWRHARTGDVSAWLMIGGTTVREAAVVWSGVPLEWRIAAVRDLDGDGKADLVWRHTRTGDVSAWLMDGTRVKAAALLWAGAPLEWQIAGIGDLDADGKADLVWRHTRTGDVSAWLMNGTTVRRTAALWSGAPLEWQIAGTDDVNGDSRADLLWHNVRTGDVSAWLMDGTTIRLVDLFWRAVPLEWQIAAVQDLDRDGQADLIWRNTETGDVSAWLMHATTVRQAVILMRAVPLEWEMQ